jgi:hypothetical protein
MAGRSRGSWSWGWRGGGWRGRSDEAGEAALIRVESRAGWVGN